RVGRAVQRGGEIAARAALDRAEPRLGELDRLRQPGQVDLLLGQVLGQVLQVEVGGAGQLDAVGVGRGVGPPQLGQLARGGGVLGPTHEGKHIRRRRQVLRRGRQRYGRRTRFKVRSQRRRG